MRTLFATSVWWSTSAKADYVVLLINQLIMMGLVPRLLSTLTLATVLFESLHILVGGRVLVW